jgi:ADP-heptose:LPS heptosyltransferase
MHVVRRYLELLRPLGVRATDEDVVFNLPHDDGSETTINRTLVSAGLTGDFAVINPGAGWDAKVWPAERYGAVASGLPIPSFVVWAGEKEYTWAKQIVASSKDMARLAPPTTLLELTALVRRTRLFIGSDTGPLHIAAAAGTPCVAMYGPTSAEICGPFGPGHVVLQGTNSMLQISSEQVLNACQQVLQRPVSGLRAA